MTGGASLRFLQGWALGVLHAARINAPMTLRQFWQARFYHFNVWGREKEREKLDYTHANPSKNKLMDHPRDWPWSSFCYYETGEMGLLRIDVRHRETQKAARAQRKAGVKKDPPLQKPRGCPTHARLAPATPSFRTEQADFFFPIRFLANGSACVERNLSSIKHPAQTAKSQRNNGARSTEQLSTPMHFWQTRSYDFRAARKEREKLDYMHANPSKNKLVDHPRDWPWSSFWYYETGELRLTRIDVRR